MKHTLFILLTFALGALYAWDDAWAGEPLHWEPLYEPGGGGAIVALSVSPRDERHIVASGDMLGAAVSFDGGESWTICQGFSAYEMASITFHPTRPNELWMATCMGPYQSIDEGRTWVSRRAGMPEARHGRYTAMVEKVLVDPADPDRLLAFGGSSRGWNQCDSFGWIWESSNGGQTWMHLGTLTDDTFNSQATKGANITRALWAPDGAVHAIANGHWWKSTDRGRAWELQAPSTLTANLISLTPHPTDPAILWCTTRSVSGPDKAQKRIPGNVFRSTDGGATWTPCTIAMPVASSNGNLTTHYSDVAVSRQAPNMLYTCDQAWNQNVTYRSPDGGITWTPILRSGGVRTATFAGPSLRLVAAPSKTDTVYGFTSEYILRTTDGGTTWMDCTAINPDPDKPDHWRGRGWNGWCTTDFEFNPYRKGQSVALAMDAGRGWISDDDLHTWRYTMGQTNPWLGGHSVGFSRDGHIYITTGQFGQGNGIQHSDDWGATWTTLAGPERGLPLAGWGSSQSYGGVYVHPDDGRRAWVILGGKLLATVNGGQTWSPIEGISEGSNIARDPTQSGRFYVQTKSAIYVTDDGATFRSIGHPMTEPRGRINCDSRGRLLACTWRVAESGLWRYDPATSLWTRLYDDPLAYECNADPSDPSRLLLVTTDDPYHDQAHGHGIWISSDDGASWSPANDGLPMLRCNVVAFDPFNPERIVVGTYGGGFVTTHWPKHAPSEETSQAILK